MGRFVGVGHSIARRVALMLLLAVALAGLVAGSALADDVATTNAATSVTSSSAMLNGYAYITSDDSAWWFEWGSSPQQLDHNTPITKIGHSTWLLSARISGLNPRAAYYFRLVVEENVSYNGTPHSGDILTFTTPVASSGGGGGGGGSGGGGGGSGGGGSTGAHRAFGKASLSAHRLHVRHGAASIPFKCKGKGGTRCKAKVSLSVAGTGKRRISCGSARLSVPSSRKRTIKIKLRRSCAAQLAASPPHSIRARLEAKFSGAQAPLRTAVTLLGT